MLIDEFHPEDIKAAIRKRYRSLLAFERAHGLARQSTSEIFRGRTSARTEKAIRRVLREDGAGAKGSSSSIFTADSGVHDQLHRQNGDAL